MKNITLLALFIGSMGLTSCETEVVGPGSDIRLEAEDQAFLFKPTEAPDMHHEPEKEVSANESAPLKDTTDTPFVHNQKG